MAFDPTKPANKTKLSSAEMRDQLTSLKALIDAQQATIDSQQSAIAGLQSQNEAKTQEIADLQDVVNALQQRCPA